jgi:hypothetical protein
MCPHNVAVLIARLLRLLLLSVLVVASAALVVRTVCGPVNIPLVSVRPPLNPEGVVGLSFILLILVGRRAGGEPERQPGRGRLAHANWLCAGLIAAAAVTLFWPNLRSPFVFDDYTHLDWASRATWRVLYEAFARVPGGHGLFFRPLTFISFWLDYQWAGFEPARWHGWSLVVHAANSCLVYALARRLGQAWPAALIAGLLFALHGTRAEPVSWMDARADLLVGFFALCTMLLVQEIVRSPRGILYLPMLLCAVLAVCAKESGFCVPVLPLSLLPLYRGEERRRLASVTVILTLVCGLVFAYRWWVLGGIGGYKDQTGELMIWHFSVVRSLNAWCLRLWGTFSSQ